MIGFELANTVPERISAFILGGGHPYGRTIPPQAQSDGADPQAFADTFLRRIGMDPAAMPPKYRDLLLDNDFRALAAAQQDRPSQAAALAKMTMPCLMFAGGADPLHDQVKRAASQIASCRFLTVGELDHGTTFRESARVLPEVRAFVAGFDW